MLLHQFSLVGILNELAAHSRKYYLTGSRFFLRGQDASKGDIDLFTEINMEDDKDHSKIADFLQKLGFTQGGSAYTDMLVFNVLSHKKAGVDIQLVTNASLKRAVQEYLIAHKSYGQLSSLTDKDWNEATTNVVKLCALLELSYAEFADKASERSSGVSEISKYDIHAHYIGREKSDIIETLVE